MPAHRKTVDDRFERDVFRGDSAYMPRVGQREGGREGREGRGDRKDGDGTGLLRCGEDDVFVVLFEAFDGVFEDGA